MFVTDYANPVGGACGKFATGLTDPQFANTTGCTTIRNAAQLCVTAGTMAVGLV